jgi:HlyD family secretion protein
VDLPPGFAAQNGEFTKVQITVGTRKALLVPRSAVRETGQLTGLYIADGSSRARFRLVKITPYDTDRVEVLSGVESGENIIAAPSDQVTDGIPVEIRG